MTSGQQHGRFARPRAWFVLFGVLVVVALFGFSGSPAQAGSTVTVSTAPQLVAAVISASSGETIQLAPGNYPIGNALDVKVNLTVEGPSSAPGATISGGSISNPSGLDSGQDDIFAVGSGDTLTLHDVVLSAAIQPSNGAIVVLGGGTLSMDHSLISSNQSNAIDVMSSAQATVTNSTITNSNSSDGIIADGSVTLNEDTIAQNDNYGIDNHGGGTVSVNNTIVSGNGFGNCFYAIGSANGPGTFSNDADSGTSCGFGSTNGSFSSATTVLGTTPHLANNGGPSSTFALPSGSVAIDHGTASGAAADDQRGFPRDANPDMGAYEFGATAPGAKLTVKKIVVGGTAVPSDFTLTVTDTTTSTVLDSSPGSSSGKQVSVPAGDSYKVTESGGPGGYVESDSAGCTGTAVIGGDPTCTITNSETATLTVKKVVVGPGSPSSFTLTVTDTTTSAVLNSSPGSSSGTQVAVPVGDNYAVTESGAQTANYVESDGAGCTGTAVQNGTPSCTITNTAKPSSLTVKKIVVGGTAQPSDFTLTVTDTTTSAVLDSSPGSADGKQVSVPAGDGYKVTESGGPGGYVESDSAGCTGTATANGTPTCTITNTVKPTVLTVKKIVVGGSAVPADFTLTVTDTSTSTVLSSSPGSSSGKQVSVPAGDNYKVTESGSKTTNYTESDSAGCTGTATVNGTASCTITNTLKTATLTVTKMVVGGTAAPSDFTLTVTDTTTSAVLDSSPGTSSGKQVAVPAGDGYKVTESGAQTSDYTESDSAGCTGTATANGTPSCTITNTAKPAKLTVSLHVVGSKLAASKFTIHVTGASPSPSSFHGSKSGTKVTLGAGSYSVKAGSKKGYKAKLSSGCKGSLQPGGAATCKITETAQKKKKKHH